MKTLLFNGWRTAVRMTGLIGITVLLFKLPTLAAPKSVPINFDSLKQVKAGVLNGGYVEAGPMNGQPVILL